MRQQKTRKQCTDMETYNLYYNTYQRFYISSQIKQRYGGQTHELIYNIDNAFTVIKYQFSGTESICETIKIVKTFDHYHQALRYVIKMNKLVNGRKYTCVVPL